jgi:DNA-binding transcriptional LysR family regulator
MRHPIRAIGLLNFKSVHDVIACLHLDSDQDWRSIVERSRLVYGGDHMHHDCVIMFEDLFVISGLSLERLKSFAHIVAAGGITAASRDDSNRQSQFSRQLKELERYFGAELIKRGRGPMKLTEAGEQLHRIISHAFGSLQEFCRHCANRPVELSIGAGESLIQWMLLPRFPRLMAEHPQLTVSFHNLRTDDILKQVADGTLDFGVVTRTNSDRQLESAPVGQLEYALFVPGEFMRNNSQKATVDLIGRVPLALLQGTDTVRHALEKLTLQRGLKLDIRLRLSSYPQLAAAVQSLKVAAVMPTLAAASLPPDRIRMIRLPFLDSLSRRVALVWNRKASEVRSSITPYAKVFTKCFRVKAPTDKGRTGN